MNSLFSFMPKKTFLLAVILLVIIGALGLILFLNQSTQTPPPPQPVISQPPSKLSPLQKTVMGKTTIDEIVKSYPDAKEQILEQGRSVYYINSPLDARPDQIIFQNKIAAFERTVTSGSTPALEISDLILKYGQAEKIVRGSKFYGGHMDTYIYPSKGLAFIANSNTDQVYELQTFIPTSLDNYLSSYGEDIKPNEGLIKE